MASILVIDNNQSGRNYLSDLLSHEGYKVRAGADEEEIYNTANGKTDLVLCNTNVSPNKGIDVIARMRMAGMATPVVLLSDQCDAPLIVAAMKSGAEDFFVKPYDMNRLVVAVKNAVCNGTPQANGAAPAKKKLKGPVVMSAGLDDIIGQGESINRVKNMIHRISESDARVLITGDNGTGKELVARAIYLTSKRKAKPFVEVNCAAIPSELIESELFGHEKGSFTSAIRQRKGKFEQAEGGTLFLDEIGDMSLSAQAKVLRVLQEKKLSRVGSDSDIDVDVRVVAATNKNIIEEIGRGNFREDLYHRLSVILIHVPPLADRVEDIPLIVNHFVNHICQEYSIAKKMITEEAIELMKKIEWTGNVRQLRNVVERLIILGGDTITPDDVRAYVH